MRRLNSLALAALGPLALLALWQLAHLAAWPSARAIPEPLATARLAARELTAAPLWRDLLASMSRLGAGLAMALPVGTALGLGLGLSRRARHAGEASVDFLRSIPPVLFFPLCLLAFGFGERARVATVALGTLGIVALAVAGTVTRAPAARRELFTLCGIRGMARFRLLTLPEALPGIFLGARLAAAAGLVIVVVTEILLGATHGLGVRARDAQIAYDAEQLFLVIALTGALGVGLSTGLKVLDGRLSRHHP